MNISKHILLNKKIVAVKGYIRDKRRKHNIPAEYILFNDKETIMEFDTDISYMNHEETNSVNIIINKDKWKNIMNSDDYKDSTEDTFF